MLVNIGIILGFVVFLWAFILAVCWWGSGMMEWRITKFHRDFKSYIEKNKEGKGHK